MNGKAAIILERDAQFSILSSTFSSMVMDETKILHCALIQDRLIYLVENLL